MTLLAAFNRVFPEVAIVGEFGPWFDVVTAVERAEVDVAILGNTPQKKRFYNKKILEQRIVALIPTSYPIARKGSVSIRDLAGYPLLYGAPGSLMISLLERRFKELGIRVRPIMTFTDRNTVFEAAAAGLGIAFSYELASSRHDNVIVRPVTDFEPVIEYVFCLDRTRKRQIVAKFLEIADDVIDRGGAYA